MFPRQALMQKLVYRYFIVLIYFFVTYSLIKKKDEEAYIDPAISAQEKEKGNEFFKKGDFGTAVKHYSEAIKI